MIIYTNIKMFFIAVFFSIISGLGFVIEGGEEKRNIVSKYGKLKVLGKNIISEHGEVVTLRGMSLFWSQIKGQYYNED